MVEDLELRHDTQHNNTQHDGISLLMSLMLSVTYKPLMLSVSYKPLMLSVTYKPLMLSVTYKPLMLSVTYKPLMLSVVMLSAVKLSVAAPWK
jgi:hypothetical protein